MLSSWVQPANTRRKQACPDNGFACTKKANRNPAGTKYVAHATQLQGACGGCIRELFEKDCQLQKRGLSHLRISKDRRKKTVSNSEIQANPNLKIKKKKYPATPIKLHITKTEEETDRRNFRLCLSSTAYLLLLQVSQITFFCPMVSTPVLLRYTCLSSFRSRGKLF